MPPLCIYRLNWARTSWGWWDDWDDTVLQTQDSKFEPWLSDVSEPPEDGEMIDMTLSSRHRIRNSSPGCLRPSTLRLGHGGSPQYWLSHGDWEDTFVSFKPPRPGTEPRTLAWKEAVLTATLGPLWTSTTTAFFNFDISCKQNALLNNILITLIFVSATV